ncbi:MAG: sulfatase-like hydrolase/transferase [Bacteroidetes bacterium]|nr:sulfatase-like hydrolase/transferase [Bacteroidota bacterium]
MIRTKYTSSNLFLVWSVRFLTILLLYSICRILFYSFNTGLFPSIDFIGLLQCMFYGLRFDISAILFLNLPIIALLILPFSFKKRESYQKALIILFIVINSLGFLANNADMAFYRFSLKRTGSDIFNFFGLGGGHDILTEVPLFLRDFWYVFVIWVLMTLFLLVISKRFIYKRSFNYQQPFIYFISQFLGMLIIGGLAVIGMRGGLQLRPISPITASRMADPLNAPVVLNTTFTMLKSVEGNGLIDPHFYSDKEVAKIYNPEQSFPLNPSDTAHFQKQNVVVLILESFSAEHFGVFNKGVNNGKYQGFTPFLDSLVGNCLAYKGFANGKRTIEGVPAVLTGIPNLISGDFITSKYNANKINSLASILNQQGYYSAFFHGGTNGTMGFDDFTKSAGFTAYFGRKEYNNENDFDGKWGIWDEHFLQYTANKMNDFKQPFFSAIFTLSSHHPYSIPAEYKGKFRKGNLPIQESVMYSDFAVRKFFKTVSKMPWYKSTLFVITADHTSEGDLPEYKSRVGEFQVPILFFKPAGNLKGYHEKVVQQVDILPSILDYLKYKGKVISFGHSVFDSTALKINVTFINDNYQIIQDNYALEFDGKVSHGLFDYKSDPLLKKNLININRKKAVDMEKILKAVIQQYNSRMINNKLVVSK